MFKPLSKLNESTIEKGLGAVTRDGLTSQTMASLTSGLFLVAFAIKLGAPNWMIGLLAAIPALTNLIQIPAIYLIEKYRNRKLITLIAVGISRSALFFIVLIPILYHKSIFQSLFFLVLGLALHSGISSIAGCSWNSWMRDLIPQKRLGSFFSRRMMLTTILGILLSMGGSYFLDFWKSINPSQELIGFSILFFIGTIFGLLGMVFIAQIPEPAMIQSKDKINFRSVIKKPFQNKDFRNLIIFLGSWNFAANLAVPFFMVYMLKRLNLSMATVTILTVISQIMNIMFLRLWGNLSDKFSNKAVLRICTPVFLFGVFLWIFTTLPDKYILTIPILVFIHIIMGIATAGIALSAGNIALKLAPQGEATVYLATNSLVNSLAASIAPIIGGIFADFFANRQLSMTFQWLSPAKHITLQTLNIQQWDFFFILAVIIGLYSIHRLGLVKEEGDVEEDIVINELIAEIQRPIRNFSSIFGIRQIIYFPFILLTKVIPISKKKSRTKLT
ncbi:MAG: MFS transporter [Candidatus Margulisbacteria bacterium GWF2_35_9]|nr:MAG: MFS transporter [Candidatus Margulisbacteria bacterium GWF2_35_9]